MKFKFLLNIVFIAGIVHAEHLVLTSAKVRELKDVFKPILEIPPKFLKFRSLWYEGNNRQQMANIITKEKIKRVDLERLIELLNQEEKRLAYKTSVIADAVNAVIMKKFLRELSHVMPIEHVEQEAQRSFMDAQQLALNEKLRHKTIIQEYLVPLLTNFELHSISSH